ncbi:MAG: entericidin A/B family lipoprotein [Pseudomonadota bacterium]
MKTLYMIAVASLFALLAGCNTIGGVGQDVSAGGDALSDAAEDVQSQL